MPSSIFLLSTIISFLLTLNLCFADPPNGPPPGPSGPSEPNPPGYDCAFEPPSGCGPDKTTPAYNECQIRDYSVSEFIQCAGETSTTTDDEDNPEPFNNVLGVLVSAVKIPACNKCKIGTTFADYQAMKDKSEKLANYLCGKLDNNDICCLGTCLGTKQPERGLKGICKNNDINLFDNDAIDCGGGSGGGEGGDAGDSSDSGNNQAAASSSSTVADAPKPTVTPSPPPSTSSSIAAQTTLPTQTPTSTQTTTSAQTPTSSPAGISSSSAGSSIRAANVMASGLLVVLLTAGIGGAL